MDGCAVHGAAASRGELSDGVQSGEEKRNALR
jgi:hypothetical protein